MDRAVFDRMAEQDATHWWYTARREILSDVIARQIRPPSGARILEVGCGTGHNLAMLESFGPVDALELDAPARELAAQRLGRAVGDAPLPELPGVERDAYDLVALLDVLEHVEEDEAALRGVAECLASKGAVLLTVPANPWMWTVHDEHHHHHRRYTEATLRSVIQRAGLTPQLVTHFNTLLFPPIAAARAWGRLRGQEESDDRMPSPRVNRLLEGVFGLERHLVGRVPLPFGVSLLAVARRG